MFDRSSGNIPRTIGAAFSETFRASGSVVLGYLGDGAVSIGPFHEGLCIAKVYRLSAIFLIENNLYGVATGAHEGTGFNDLILRSCGYNILGLVVDGMDPMAVKQGRAIGGSTRSRRSWAGDDRGQDLRLLPSEWNVSLQRFWLSNQKGRGAVETVRSAQVLAAAVNPTRLTGSETS